ncbi:hypothetical protein D0861_07858 [Hortaea werneckii]|uniref:Uncharacterized protein n=1 Tax=Hortaea werneckii TaxID=91943 RepID=A0A3M7F0W8_HORWE|nr:hypothetical protein D0861_07858 [Hortaea werneckii]
MDRKLLKSRGSSNFETRMVAELALYWMLYEHRVNGTLWDRHDLSRWKSQWARLLDQPGHQVLLMCYSFGQLFMCEQVLSSNIMHLAINTPDATTKHLTDHVYHMIAFAAVTALRVMSKYREKLQASIDLGQMETLVLKTVEWLDSIETVSYTGRIMSDLIKATQRTLGSRISSSTQISPPALLMDSPNLAAPDLFAANTAEFDWDALIPDWPSLATRYSGA